MTDILDFNFSNQESFVKKNYHINNNIKKTVQSRHCFHNSYYLQSIFSSSQEKCYKFFDLNDVYSIIIKIHQSRQSMNVKFKLLKINEIVKIKSNYLKSYFAGEFLKSQNYLFHRKINPLNGQISLQFSLFNDNINFQSELLNLIEFIKKYPHIVVDFWKNVLKIIDGKYFIQQKTDCKDKLNDIKILSSLSRKQKQGQTIYSIKPIIQNYCLPLTNQISNMRKYLIFQGPQPQATKINWQYRKKLQQIQKDKKLLHQNNIKNIQNYQHIQYVNLINQKQKLQIFQKIKKSQKEDIIKIQDKNLGKLFLNHSGYQNQTVDVMIEKIGYINRTHQFNFLNYYFIVKEEKKKVLLKMALKKFTLKQYLAKNCMTISFQSKLKIFLQIFFAIQVLWQKFGIFTGFISLEKIQITKTLIIKLQNIVQWELLSQQKNELLQYNRYIAKTQTVIRLQNIFQGLFYHKQLYNIKPTQKMKMKSLVQLDKHTNFIQNIVDEKIVQAPLYGLPQILNSLSYCFKQYSKYQNLQLNYKSEQEKWCQFMKIKEKLKNGSFDLMLGALLKSLEVVKDLS